MKKFLSFSRKHFFWIIFFLILFLAAVLRFYDYENRYGLAYDQAHDAIIARYAVLENKLPLVGPFSSAGPFQTGGEWYWLLMIPTAVFPFSMLSPWVFITLLYLGFVACIMLLGKEIKGNMFGLFIGSFAAVSTAQISQSLNLTNQAPHAFLGLLAIWSMFKYIQRKKPIFLFFMTFFISLSISIHLQGIALLVFLFITILLTGFPRKNDAIAIFLGLLIPTLPILIYDLQHDFFNIRNMFQYYLFDQYKISFDVLGRRWLTYIGVFIPQSWSHILGGWNSLGYTQLIGTILLYVYLFIKKRLSREWLIIGLSTFLMVALLRYTRTPLFESYLVFLHPFIFLLTAYCITELYNKNKIVAVAIFLFIFLGSLFRSIHDMKNPYNYTAVVSKLFLDELNKKFPNDKFAVYDRDFEARDKSLPLTLFLDEKGKISNSGKKIGMSIHAVRAPVIAGEEAGYRLYDISASSSAQLRESGWAFINPSEIYKNTEDWYRTK